MTRAEGCPLCDGAGGTLVFAGAKFRVIRADEPGIAAFYRVVWNDHVAEFSDLDEADRAVCLRAVVDVEQALRRHVQPHKVNLAALGNMVPHLHWHVIARFRWDARFPDPVWGPPQREPGAAELAAVTSALPALEKELAATLGRWA